MEFTRKPIIETIITAKEGCKLVVRSSKGAGQEEYFVDAVEVVSFGNSFFFRSQEKPKSFLVPASDYEILEVREARMVLKNVGFDRTIKIGGGKDTSSKAAKEQEKPAQEQAEGETAGSSSGGRSVERKRDRRRSFRRRRKGEEQQESEDVLESEILPPPSAEKPIELPEPQKSEKERTPEEMALQQSVIRSLLPPPPNLIADTIEKYKDNKLFEGVFIKKGEEAQTEEGVVSLAEYESFEVSEDAEEEIMKQRQSDEEAFQEEKGANENELYPENVEEEAPKHEEPQENAEAIESEEKPQEEASVEEEKSTNG